MASKSRKGIMKVDQFRSALDLSEMRLRVTLLGIVRDGLAAGIGAEMMKEQMVEAVLGASAGMGTFIHEYIKGSIPEAEYTPFERGDLKSIYRACSDAAEVIVKREGHSATISSVVSEYTDHVVKQATATMQRCAEAANVTQASIMAQEAIVGTPRGREGTWERSVQSGACEWCHEQVDVYRNTRQFKVHHGCRCLLVRVDA